MSIEFEHVLEIETHKLKVGVEAEGNVFWENYGADADGRRGVMTLFVEDTQLTIRDGQGKDITDKLQARHEKIFDDLIEIASQKLADAYEKGE